MISRDEREEWRIKKNRIIRLIGTEFYKVVDYQYKALHVISVEL